MLVLSGLLPDFGTVIELALITLETNFLSHLNQ